MHIMSLCWLPQHKFIKHLVLYDLAMYMKNVDKTCNTSFVIVFQNKIIFCRVTFKFRCVYFESYFYNTQSKVLLFIFYLRFISTGFPSSFQILLIKKTFKGQFESRPGTTVHSCTAVLLYTSPHSSCVTPCWSVTVSQCQSVIMSQCPHVTVSLP